MPAFKGNNSMKRKGGPLDSKKQKQPQKQQPQKSATPTQQPRPRKNGATVTDGKRIWNQLRQHNNTREQTEQCMEELMGILAGKSHEIALQHDGSRLVQAALQFGSGADRSAVVRELVLQADVAELCRSQYAHFVVLKALKYGSREHVASILAKLRGHVPKLAVHAVASKVIEAVFQQQHQQCSNHTKELKQELYGPHISLFASDTLQKLDGKPPSLQACIQLFPTKRDVTVEFVRNVVQKGLEKQLYGCTFFQDYLLEYMHVVDGGEIRQLAATAADQTIHLLTSKSGSHCAALLASYGTAKERKRMLKSIKGYSRSGLLHSHAYLAVLRLVQVTDDTVAVQKNVLQELWALSDDKGDAPLLELALSDTASKLFLMILAESTEKILDPYELSVLFPNPVVLEDGKEVSTSRKAEAVRRTELLQYVREPLIRLCSSNDAEIVNKLLRSVPGSAVLQHVFTALQQPSSVADAVLNVCEASLLEKDETTSVFEDKRAHRTIKNLILTGDNFATQFLERFGNRLMVIAASNRGAFVVAALCKKCSTSKQLSKGQIVTWSTQKGPTAGFEALLKAL
jgi:pumilio homology domain family member 6